MATGQSIADTIAIGGSIACALHCLALPLAILLLPSLAALPIADESFHYGMLAWILPTSVFALSIGCRRHRDFGVFGLGVFGLALLIGAAVFGHTLLGAGGEMAMTLAGAGVIGMSHLRNMSRCRDRDCGSRAV